MNVYQIKVHFNVTEQVKRYVYVYLVVGKHCYLIDSGVAGCQQQIVDQMQALGRDISELKGIFLTHAHPDHIGTAAWFKEQTGCKIYTSKGEALWIDNIDLPFDERPIPNFYTLAGKSVEVDQLVKDGDEIKRDETFSIQVIGTAGHSIDEVSYKVEDVLFIGDSIPVKGDIPIYIDYNASIRSLDKIRSEDTCRWFYPAWDTTYDSKMLGVKVDEAMQVIQKMDFIVKQKAMETQGLKELVRQVCDSLHNPALSENPLFARTVKSHLN